MATALKAPKMPSMKVPKVPSKALPPGARLNKPKTHHTPTAAVNLPNTSRASWKKLG